MSESAPGRVERIPGWLTGDDARGLLPGFPGFVVAASTALCLAAPRVPQFPWSSRTGKPVLSVLRHQGGVRGRVVTTGTIRPGDAVTA